MDPIGITVVGPSTYTACADKDFERKPTVSHQLTATFRGCTAPQQDPRIASSPSPAGTHRQGATSHQFAFDFGDCHEVIPTEQCIWNSSRRKQHVDLNHCFNKASRKIRGTSRPTLVLLLLVTLLFPAVVLGQAAMSSSGMTIPVANIAWVGGVGEPNVFTGPYNGYPGVRAYHNMFADVEARCFYIFGGETMVEGTSKHYNDVWSYDLVKHRWTLLAPRSVTVDAQGSYGPRGVSNSLYVPPSRSYAAGAYDQTAKTFFIFGGLTGMMLFRYVHPHILAVDDKPLSDLWCFNVTSRMWTYLNGLTATQQYGSFPSASSAADVYPGSRFGGTLVLSLNSMNTGSKYLYLHGGEGYGKPSYIGTSFGHECHA